MQYKVSRFYKICRFNHGRKKLFFFHSFFPLDVLNLFSSVPINWVFHFHFRRPALLALFSAKNLRALKFVFERWISVHLRTVKKSLIECLQQMYKRVCGSTVSKKLLLYQLLLSDSPLNSYSTLPTVGPQMGPKNQVVKLA